MCVQSVLLSLSAQKEPCVSSQPHRPEASGHDFQRGPGPAASCWRARRSSLKARCSALGDGNSSSHKCKPFSLPQVETSQGYVRFHSLRPSVSFHPNQGRCCHWTQQGKRTFTDWGPSSKQERSSCTNTAGKKAKATWATGSPVSQQQPTSSSFSSKPLVILQVSEHFKKPLWVWSRIWAY